jgi:hypothetical protein
LLLIAFSIWIPIIARQFGFPNKAVGVIEALPYLIGAFPMYFWCHDSIKPYAGKTY